jgi:hypothetical protein
MAEHVKLTDIRPVDPWRGTSNSGADALAPHEGR